MMLYLSTSLFGVVLAFLLPNETSAAAAALMDAQIEAPITRPALFVAGLGDFFENLDKNNKPAAKVDAKKGGSSSKRRQSGANNLKSHGLRREENRRIQQALTELGYSPGPIDGLPGEKTNTAIRRYQEDNSLLVTGIPSLELLAHMESRVDSQEKQPTATAVNVEETSTRSASQEIADPQESERDVAYSAPFPTQRNDEESSNTEEQSLRVEVKSACLKNVSSEQGEKAKVVIDVNRSPDYATALIQTREDASAWKACIYNKETKTAELSASFEISNLESNTNEIRGALLPQPSVTATEDTDRLGAPVPALPKAEVPGTHANSTAALGDLSAEPLVQTADAIPSEILDRFPGVRETIDGLSYGSAADKATTTEAVQMALVFLVEMEPDGIAADLGFSAKDFAAEFVINPEATLGLMGYDILEGAGEALIAKAAGEMVVGYMFAAGPLSKLPDAWQVPLSAFVKATVDEGAGLVMAGTNPTPVALVGPIVNRLRDVLEIYKATNALSETQAAGLYAVATGAELNADLADKYPGDTTSALIKGWFQLMRDNLRDIVGPDDINEVHTIVTMGYKALLAQRQGDLDSARDEVARMTEAGEAGQGLTPLSAEGPIDLLLKLASGGDAPRLMAQTFMSATRLRELSATEATPASGTRDDAAAISTEPRRRRSDIATTPLNISAHEDLPEEDLKISAIQAYGLLTKVFNSERNAFFGNPKNGRFGGDMCYYGAATAGFSASASRFASGALNDLAVDITFLALGYVPGDRDFNRYLYDIVLDLGSSYLKKEDLGIAATRSVIENTIGYLLPTLAELDPDNPPKYLVNSVGELSEHLVEEMIRDSNLKYGAFSGNNEGATQYLTDGAPPSQVAINWIYSPDTHYFVAYVAASCEGLKKRMYVMRFKVRKLFSRGREPDLQTLKIFRY